MKKSEEKALKQVLRWSGWEKEGGHPDVTLNKIRGMLAAAGFRRKAESASASPDGYRVRSGQTYLHPLGLEAYISEYLGETRHYNRYSFTVRVKDRRRK